MTDKTLVEMAEILWNSQEQCDEDRRMVAVSRQALNEIMPMILETTNALRAQAGVQGGEATGEYPEAAEVCAEAYQVVGCLLSDLGIFDT